MMEHPSIMSPEESISKTGFKLAAVTLALAMAGCSTMERLNPFGGDDDEAPPPVTQTSTMPTGSSSMDANRTEPMPTAQ